MKKIIFFCLLFSGCASTQTNPPSVPVGNRSFVLTSAYTGAEGLVNVYTANDVPDAKLTVSSAPTANPELRQMALNMIRQLFQTTGLAQDKYQILSQEKDGAFFSSVDFISSIGRNRIYSLSLTQDGKDQTTRTIILKMPLDAEQTREQAYQRLRPDLEKFISLPLYPTRPGHKQPDDSPDLQELKTFLAADFQPQRQITRQGNITSVQSVDNNETQAFQLISDSQEPDVSAWLDKNIADYSPKFLYAMMIRAAKRGEPEDNIIFWMTAARLRAGSDAALCKDRFVSQYLTVMAWEFIPQIQPYISEAEWKTRMNDPKAMDVLFRKVTQWDKKHPQKNSPEWFCNSGHAASTSQSYPQKEWNKRRKQYRKDLEKKQKNKLKNVK